jgi:hypothetical protein
MPVDNPVVVRRRSPGDKVRIACDACVVGSGAAVVDRYGQSRVRQTRWIRGRYRRTVDDVRQGVCLADRVARCAWAIELHNSPSEN